MKNEPSKVRTEQPCPGCGNPAPVQQKLKNGQRFEFIDCQSCHASWGRIVDASGQWHLLGNIDEKGLLLSRRANLKVEEEVSMKGEEPAEMRWAGPVCEPPALTTYDFAPAVLLVLNICGERSELVIGKRLYRPALKAKIGDFIIAYGVVKDNRLIVSDWGNHGPCEYIEGDVNIMRWLFQEALSSCGSEP